MSQMLYQLGHALASLVQALQPRSWPPSLRWCASCLQPKFRNGWMRDLGRIMELGDDLRLSEYATTMFLNMVPSQRGREAHAAMVAWSLMA